MSAKAVAITLAPRSWPSWPILTTSMRGRRPSAGGEGLDVGLDAPRRPRRPRRRRHRRRRCVRISARWRPNTFSMRVADLAHGGAGAGGLDRQRRAGCRRRAAPSVSAVERGLAGGVVARRRGSGRAGRSAPRAPRRCRRRGRRRVSSFSTPVLVDADDRPPRRGRRGPGGGRRPPRCAASACPDATALVMPPSSSTSLDELPGLVGQRRRSGSRRSSCRRADRRHG